MIELIKDKNILKIIPYGSQVYGTTSDNSDCDYIVVTTDNYSQEDRKKNNNDYHFYTISQWEEMCKNLDIRAVEAYFTPISLYKKGNKIPITIDYEIIWRSFCKIASNSWVKARKKMQQGDDYIGRKSLFHSLRILYFTNNIMEQSCIPIMNPFVFNYIYYDIMDKEKTYEQLKEKFQPIYNNLRSKVKKSYKNNL